MKHQQTLATVIVALLCSGVLVLFTDVENDLMRQMERWRQQGAERLGQVPSRIETW